MTPDPPFSPPPAELLHALSAPLRRWFSPVFLGLEEAEPKRPALYVGNHTLYGVLDAPLMAEHLYRAHGVFLRSLGDRVHAKVPGWSHFLTSLGAVVGTPDHCAALMRAGESILVFPGGSREVFRRKGERHSLIWKQRVGFARMALEHGYDIVPFGALGADENYKILFDAGDVERSPLLSGLAERVGLLWATRGGENLPPLAVGVGPTPIPRPQRLYFGFGARVTPPAGPSSDEAAWALREQVAASIQDQIQRLRAYREADRQTWSALRRVLAPSLDDEP